MVKPEELQDEVLAASNAGSLFETSLICPAVYARGRILVSANARQESDFSFCTTIDAVLIKK